MTPRLVAWDMNVKIALVSHDRVATDISEVVSVKKKLSCAIYISASDLRRVY